jgi:AAA15 family ATPase/GTPase
MKIERIEIKNFKTLEDVAIDFDGYFSASHQGQSHQGQVLLFA